MKTLVFLLVLVSSANIFAATKVNCNATKAFQVGSSMQADVDLSFELEKAGNNSEIKNVLGHVFVKSPYENSNPNYSTEDSYMGFFQIDSVKANSSYHPNKYKGYAQFQNFNASHTAGVEDGMWGYLVVDVTSTDAKTKAAYVFQAGDHMGGTILLECQNR